jgi:DNA-binding HxlR family transcriptional regulator/alkylated DNA nucleotide flippase Atl1
MASKIRFEDRECPLSATLGLVGEWWTLLILHDAFDGYTRFDQFEANLGISSSLLTSRLKRLVGIGLLERRPYQTNPIRYEYLLTDLGRSLRPVIVALAAWGNARLDPGKRSMVLVDAETGIEAEPVLVDRDSGRRVDGPGFVFTAGPAASEPFRDRYAGRPAPLTPEPPAGIRITNVATRTDHSPAVTAPPRTPADDVPPPPSQSRTATILGRIRAIPVGCVSTYADIDAKAPRLVGRILATRHDNIPWYRVVRADGTAPMGTDQLARLRSEGVPIRNGRVDLAQARLAR